MVFLNRIVRAGISSSSRNKIIKCRAAVAWEPGAPLQIEDIEVSPPQSNEVRIKITHTSLCQTDITFWQNKGMKHLFPRIFGHEAAGIVESVGEGVSNLCEGDHVIPIFTGECSDCKYCKSQKTNLCGSLRVNPEYAGVYGGDGTRFKQGSVEISHFMGTSTFSQYTVVNKGCLAKVPKRAPLDKVCLLSCGITTGVGAVWNVAKLQKDDTVAIFGLGTVGLAIAQAAKLSGASRIIGVDINSEKHELGKQFGITDFLNPLDHDRPIQEVIMELCQGGVDYSFECIGSAALMQAAFESTHNAWGVTIVAGVPSGPATLSTDPVKLLFGHSLKGTIFGGYKPSQIHELVEKYMRKEIMVDEFVTHTLPFEKINDAIQLLMQSQCLRCVVSMH
ncbi:hypothetical protein SELMODRAFT_412432 [Selaginella moellendorffii]|uniref:Enoyl reductase (ER) domain-containing protein n=1 Tax=Selaginella moellendorffii TaxID=88036 RepID=D8RLH1_SELML|nr:alcohol dehydrogenase [Selaginella moellendorffii]EFJ26915.1 hypothetical protein SELMODRAFT_412432 [Selaginella moellendorffii]|eukprot:XP_002971998.1 alcohol dehydrogenase [Selaginella moellendorffii]